MAGNPVPATVCRDVWDWCYASLQVVFFKAATRILDLAARPGNGTPAAVCTYHAPMQLVEVGSCELQFALFSRSVPRLGMQYLLYPGTFQIAMVCTVYARANALTLANTNGRIKW